MTEYRLFVHSMYDRACGFYQSYGISVFVDGQLTRIVKDVSPERDKVERLVSAFNDNALDPCHLTQAVEDYLCDYEV